MTGIARFGSAAHSGGRVELDDLDAGLLERLDGAELAHARGSAASNGPSTIAVSPALSPKRRTASAPSAWPCGSCWAPT